MIESGSRLTERCAAISCFLACRSKADRARASMLCARARAGFSSIAWRSERMRPREISRVHLDDAERRRAHRRARDRARGLAGRPPGAASSRPRPAAPSLASREGCGNRRAPTTPRRSRIEFERPLRMAEARARRLRAIRRHRECRPLRILEMRLRVHHVTARELVDLGRASAEPRSRAPPLRPASLCRPSTSSRSSIVAIGPERLVACARRPAGADSRTRFADEQRGAFEDRLHVQLPGDLRERQRDPLVLHRGRFGR